MPKKSNKSQCIDAIVFNTLERLVNVKNSKEEEFPIWDECIEDLTVVVTNRYAVDFIHGSVVKSRAWCSDVLPNLDEARFRQMVRVNWLQFHIILDAIREDPIFKQKLQFPVEKQLMIALYRLGSSGEGGTVAKVANFFGIGDGGTVEIVTKRVFKAILAKQEKYLTWPPKEERDAIVASTYSELPHCVGYIDCIPLAERPINNPDDYYSRKQRFSIKAQVVCDYKKIIRNLNVRVLQTNVEDKWFILFIDWRTLTADPKPDEVELDGIKLILRMSDTTRKYRTIPIRYFDKSIDTFVILFINTSNIYRTT